MRILLLPVIFTIAIADAISVSAQTPLKGRDSTISGPQTFAIIVGISNYKYVRPLTYADKDAEMFRDYLKSPAGGSVKNENIFCLLNEDALSSNFWSKGFQWLRAKKLQKGDRLFLYLAGHGDAIDEDQFFFLGYDCNPGGDKNNYLAGGVIQLFNLKKKIAAETAKGVDVFFIMDACRTSELPGGLPGMNFLNTAITEKKAGEVIMLATGAGQESLEHASIGNGHGLFTYYLVDGLTGAADSMQTTDFRINFAEIQEYVSRNVPAVARQRFNKDQDPYFCCNEYSEKIVGRVDTAYFNNWLRLKKIQQRGPGNSFHGFVKKNSVKDFADTTLEETYNLFYTALKNNQLAGNGSADFYFEQMNRTDSSSPYTLDAKTSLAAAFINDAQQKINQYIACGDNLSAAEKQQNFEAGNRLEKAVNLLRDEEPEYAATLTGHMYFLKASGDFGDAGRNGNMAAGFQNAYAAFSNQPGAAFINNRLATLHLQNNRADSAVHYARKAIAAAPNWKCAYGTLSLAFDALNQPDSADEYRKRSQAQHPALPIAKKPAVTDQRKVQIGVIVMRGNSDLQLNYSNWEQRNINYADSLIRIVAEKGKRFDVGLICQVNFGTTVAWRPSLLISIEEGMLIYERTPATGMPGPEFVNMKTTSLSASLPLIFKLAKKNIVPFIMAGPSLNFLLQQESSSSSKLPVKTFNLSGDAGFGIDFSIPQAKIILTPEFKFSAGLTSIRGDADNIYTNTLADLKRRSYSIGISIRRR